jgi:predicted deacylase
VEKIVSVPSERDGMFRPAVDRDAHVTKGAKIGAITDYLSRPVQDVLAPETGIVMFVRAVPSLKKGDTIVNIGVVRK